MIPHLLIYSIFFQMVIIIFFNKLSISPKCFIEYFEGAG